MVVFSSIVGLVALGTLKTGTLFRAVLGPVTPLGGLLMIGGWLAWARQVWASRNQ